jgi:thymidylate kinase
MPAVRKKRIRVVSFSGIDGAGKSTQIASLYERLIQSGIHVIRLTFWQDVARFGRIRASASHNLFGSEEGVGTPAQPVNRRDKNARPWYMTPLRFILYFLDALSLRAVLAKALTTDADIVIFDRYVYDELANLSPQSRMTRAYVRMLLKLVPRPDIAYLLDADPVAARRRKPEYPLAFLHTNRKSYLGLAELGCPWTLVHALPRSEVERLIAERTLALSSLHHDGFIPSARATP